MKFCKDCAHCKLDGEATSICLAPENSKVSLVTGEKTAATHMFCIDQRRINNEFTGGNASAATGLAAPVIWLTCGPAARWFAPKHAAEQSAREALYSPAMESAQDAIQRSWDAALQDVSHLR